MIKHLFILFLLVPVFFLSPKSSEAHALDPGYLELKAIGGDAWRVFWRKPNVGDTPMAIGVALPEACDPSEPTKPRFDGAAWVAQWVATCPGGLTGGTIGIRGLEKTRTDVLVRYELEDGEARTHRLTPAISSFTVPQDPGLIEVFKS